MNLILVVGTLIGWGHSQNHPGSQPRKLQQLEVPFVTLETCQRAWDRFEYKGMNESSFVTGSMICADGRKGYSNCSGDSGELNQNKSATGVYESSLR